MKLYRNDDGGLRAHRSFRFVSLWGVYIVTTQSSLVISQPVSLELRLGTVLPTDDPRTCKGSSGRGGDACSQINREVYKINRVFLELFR